MTSTPPAPCPAPCAVCNRAARGIVVTLPKLPAAHFCSFHCSEVWMIAQRRDIPMEPSEERAVAFGGRQAGAYLEEIGKFDLREMTAEEWATFCGRLYRAACDDLSNQASEHIPF